MFKISIIALCFCISCNNAPKDKLPEQPKNFCASIHRDSTLTLSAELKPIDSLMQTKTGVYVLEDGDGAMVTRAWLSEYAQKTIDVQYFIFSTDNVGLIACDYLVRAADRGVKVRLLVDDIMVDAGAHDILTMDSHPNIEIKIYNPGINLGKNIFQKLNNFRKNFKNANQRMHNKTFTVDGTVAITGGRNIADEYFDYDHEYNFRDRDVLLLGKTAHVIQNSFNDFWNNNLCVPVANIVQDTSINLTDKNRFNRLHQYACNPTNFWPQVRNKITLLPKAFKQIQQSGELVWCDSVEFVTDVPGKNNSPMLSGGGLTTTALINLINNAKTSVDINSPYLITTPQGDSIFKAAVKRGVKIRILTNSLLSNDNYEAFAGYQKCRKNLLKTGIEIYEFKPDATERFKVLTGALQKKMNYTPTFGLHAKTMVIDGNTTVIGTFNLDPRSANLNTECFAVIHSAKVTQGVLKGMEVEFKPENSWRTTATFNPDNEAPLKSRVNAFVKKLVPNSIL